MLWILCGRKGNVVECWKANVVWFNDSYMSVIVVVAIKKVVVICAWRIGEKKRQACTTREYLTQQLIMTPCLTHFDPRILNVSKLYHPDIIDCQYASRIGEMDLAPMDGPF